MAMVRTAMKTGSGHLLWPRGIQYIEDVPADLTNAINHACKVLNWYENVPPDKMPPEWMFPYDDEISAWFERINNTEPEERDDRTEVPMWDNELLDD